MRESYKVFLERLPLVRCAEVGVAHGYNAIDMLNNFSLPRIKFYLIDNYNPDNSTFQFGPHKPTEGERETFIKGVQDRLVPYGNKVTLIIKESTEAAKDFPDEFFDYIYIDAQHEEDAVLRDLTAWWPKLKNGGLFAGHDCGTPGVARALCRFFRRHEVKDTDWYLYKEGEDDRSN